MTLDGLGFGFLDTNGFTASLMTGDLISGVISSGDFKIFYVTIHFRLRSHQKS